MTPSTLIAIAEAHGLQYQGTMCCLPEVGRVSIQAFLQAAQTRIGWLWRQTSRANHVVVDREHPQRNRR